MDFHQGACQGRQRQRQKQEEEEQQEQQRQRRRQRVDNGYQSNNNNGVQWLLRAC